MEKPADIAAARLAPAALAQNFSGLVSPFDRFEARVAAERCLFCYDAPCVKACPTQIDIPLFVRQIANANPIGAAKTILNSNIMGGTCARVCPTETLCEEVCVREIAEGKPIEIGRLQRYATDVLFESGKQVFSRAAATGKKIAVVGAGPAGLACAHHLACLGHDITIYETREKSGGLNEYGIAAYKVPDNFAGREAAFILGIGGIKVEHGKSLGRDVTLAGLRQTFDAVFLGMGLAGVNALAIGSEPQGVEDAVAFIARLRQARDLSTIAVGRRILVIGGGMTAIDVASQTKRLGAEDVTIVYRGPRARMKASAYEQELAQTDGVLIRDRLRPLRLVAKAGVLTGAEFAYEGSTETIILPCDQLFKAIGQTFRVDHVDGTLALFGGRIAVDAQRRTSLANVWAGGDCIAGGQDLTVAAVEDGKQAAIAMHSSLSSNTGGGPG